MTVRNKEFDHEDLVLYVYGELPRDRSREIRRREKENPKLRAKLEELRLLAGLPAPGTGPALTPTRILGGLATAASIGVVVFGVGFARATVAAHELGAAYKIALTRVESLQLALASVSRPAAVPPTTKETRRRDFDQARRIRPVFGYQEKPGVLGLLLDPFFGPPNYTAIEVTWDQADPAQGKYVWVDGQSALNPILTHEYALPASGSRKLVTVRIQFHTTDAAMRDFVVRSVITETIPVVLTSDGVQFATSDLTEGVAVDIKTPSPDGVEVPEEFELGFDVTSLEERVGSIDSSPNVIHVLVRARDGSSAARGTYWVQPFQFAISDLVRGGKRGPLRFETWVSLRGILSDLPNNERPTEFEIKVVQLPVRLVEWQISKRLIDLDRKVPKGVVMATRVVKLPRPSKDEVVTP